MCSLPIVSLNTNPPPPPPSSPLTRMCSFRQTCRRPTSLARDFVKPDSPAWKNTFWWENGSGDRFQNQKERKLFASASQALFRVQEKYQIEHVWVSFHMFWRPTFFIDENCKITEPMHFWTWVLLRAFCTTFRRKRFIARTWNATDFRAPRPWQFVGWRQAQKNGKKWVAFNASFTPPCQFFRGFRLFRPFQDLKR